MSKKFLKGKPPIISEKISFFDLIFKYTFMDSIISCLINIGGTMGVFLRMSIYPSFLKKCGRGFTVKEYVVLKFSKNISIKIIKYHQ